MSDTALDDSAAWVLVDDACKRFKFGERTIYRWLTDGCRYLDGKRPRVKREKVVATTRGGIEQLCKKPLVFVKDLEQIAAAQAQQLTAPEATGRITTVEAIQRIFPEDSQLKDADEAARRLRVRREWLRRRIKCCHELGGKPLDVKREEVRRTTGYRTRPYLDFLFLAKEIDEIVKGRQKLEDVYRDSDGKEWYTRRAVLANRDGDFRGVTSRMIQFYDRPYAALAGKPIRTLQRPYPPGRRGGRYPSLTYFLEDDLIRLSADRQATGDRPADAMRGKPKQKSTARRGHGGRLRSEKTQEVYRACYERIEAGDTLKEVLRYVRQKYPESNGYSPPDTTQKVSTYAARHASYTGKTWPIPRTDE